MKDKDTDYLKRQKLITAYRGAGVDFLAMRLLRIFKRIENQDDVVLHNYIMNDIDVMISNDPETFLKVAARTLLFWRKKENPKLGFLRKLTDIIFSIGGRYGKNNQK